VVTAIVVALILGVGLLGGMKGEAAMTARHHEAVLAQYVAEGAVAEAVAAIRNSLALGSLKPHFLQTLSQSQDRALPSVEPVNSRLLLRELLTSDTLSATGQGSLPAGFQDQTALPSVTVTLVGVKPFSDAGTGDPIEKYGTLRIRATSHIGDAASTIEILRDFKVVALSQPPLPGNNQYSLFTALGLQPRVSDVPTVQGDMESKDVFQDAKYFPYLSVVEEMAQSAGPLSSPDPAEVEARVRQEIRNNPDWQALFSGQSPGALQYFGDSRKISCFFQDKDEFGKYFGAGKGALTGVSLIRNQGSLDLGTLELKGRGMLVLDRFTSARVDLRSGTDDMIGLLYMAVSGILTLRGDFTGFVFSPGSPVDATGGATMKKGNVYTRFLKGWEKNESTKSNFNITSDTAWLSNTDYTVTIGEQNCSWRMEGK
jgi:hypothetical protein